MAYIEPGIDSAGLHVPEYEDIKQRLLDSFRQIFGDDLYLGEDTQDYQMIAEFAECLDDVYSLIIESYNSRNPNYATGTALDMIIALNGIRRIVATHSTVILTLTGSNGAEIPAGSIAKDIAGYQWATSADAIIGSDGTVDVLATCTVAGAVNAPANSITQIMNPTAGWIGVTNANDAIPGQNNETDAELHERREKSVANSGVSIVDAIYGNIRNIDTVSKARMYENSTGSPDANGIPGHSICVCVLGGDTEEIGKRIFNKKSPGCGTYGNTSATVRDVFGNNNTVYFNRPVEVPLTITVSLRTFAGYNNGTIDQIKSNIVSYISGLNIGDDLNVGLLWAPILAVNTDPQNPVCSPTSVIVNEESMTLSVGYNEYVTIDPDDITVTIDN